MFRIAPDGWSLPCYTPGQFAVVGLPKNAPRIAMSDPETPAGDPGRLIRRAYSIASSPLARDHVEIFVNLVTSGEFTPRLFALRPGDRLWLGPKLTGLFTLRDVPRDRNVALVATGTGVAPYMSMLRTELECGTPAASRCCTARVTRGISATLPSSTRCGGSARTSPTCRQ